METEHQINLFLNDKEFSKLTNGGTVAGSLRLREGPEQIADLRVYIRTRGEQRTQTAKTGHGKVVVGPLKRRFSFAVDSSLPKDEAIELLKQECEEAIEFIEKIDKEQDE